MSSTPNNGGGGRLPSLAEIGTADPPAPSELDTIGRLIDRYATDAADQELLAAMLGV
jgi:hypothetical protein